MLYTVVPQKVTSSKANDDKVLHCGFSFAQVVIKNKFKVQDDQKLVPTVQVLFLLGRLYLSDHNHHHRHHIQIVVIISLT